MSLAHGPKMVLDGLVFAYDMGPNPGINKSWKGKPTTNLLTNGHFANGQHVTQYTSGGSYGSYSIEYFPNNPGHSDYVLRQNGGTNGEYEMGPTLSPSTTYCVSCWVAYSPDSDLNTQILHTRWYYPGGNSTTGGAGTLAETKIKGGLTWERRYVTFTTPADATGVFQWYLGYSTGGTRGFRYFTDLQIEVGSYPNPFVNGARSNTQALLDWVGGNVITANSVTYNTNGTFTFVNTSTNEISLPNSIGYNSNNVSAFSWFKRNGSPSGGYHIICGGQELEISIPDPGGQLRVGIVSGGTRYVSNHGSGLLDGNWHYVGFTSDGTTKTAYIDGISVGTQAVTGLLTTSFANRKIGRYGSSTTYYANGDIPAYYVYNRALTATEVSNNFNALKGRYGL